MIPIHCTTAWPQGHTGLLPAIYTQAASQMALVFNVLPCPPTYCAHLINQGTISQNFPPLPTLPNFIGHPLQMLPSPQLIPPTLKLLPPPPPLIQNTTQDIAQLISHTSTSSAGASHTAHTAANLSSQHMVGHGLPPVSKKLAEWILAGEFVDLAELPPAKGKVRPLQSPE